MAKKNKKTDKQTVSDKENIAVEESSSSVPKFEIGVKGDDFDLKYRRAYAEKTAEADRLLSDLSRESKADKYNFLSFAMPAVLVIIIALSLSIVSRGDIEEAIEAVPFSAENIISGRYAANLNKVYESTTPFGGVIDKIAAALGFCPKPPEEEPDILPEAPENDPDDVDVPVVTTQMTSDETPTATVSETATEPTVTTVPTTQEPTLPTPEETTEPEIYETTIMYASATLNIRFGPTTSDAILGYYNKGDEVEVIVIRDDGWAEVLFNDFKAYCSSDYLSEERIKAETTTRQSRTEATTAADEPEPTTQPPEDDAQPETAVAQDEETLPEDSEGSPDNSDENSVPENEPSESGGAPESDQNGEETPRDDSDE